MAYCTQADVQIEAGGEHRLRQLSDVDANNAVNESQVASAIAKADGMIDSYVKKRFAVPLSPVPEAIKNLSAELAVYVLKQRRNMVTDRDMQQQEQRLQQLRDIATGVIVTGAPSEPAKSELIVDEHYDRPETKDVSRSKLKGFW